MHSCFDGIIARYVLAASGFERVLRTASTERWTWPTPCAEWNVRQLVNHVVRGNLNYVLLARGGTADEFLRLRDVDALATDPVDAHTRSVRECASVFSQPGVLQQVLDYPLGAVVGQQALAIRTADTAVHTWDLARAVGADDTLDPGLTGWIDGHFEEIYAGLSGTDQFFAAPVDGSTATHQDRVLRRVGRDPSWTV